VTRKRRTQRLRRVDEALRQIISDELLGRGDARLATVAVTGVEASPDTAFADVFVQVSGGPQRRERALRALERARVPLQATINQQMHLRHTPVLRFHLDESADRGARIEALLADYEPPAEEDAREGEG
jgi:ribosome-binding factor A